MPSFIKLTKGLITLVDDEDFEFLNQWKWVCKTLSKINYAGRKENNEVILMHRIIMNTPDGMQTDHINHNTLDNRKENLRVCTCAENQHNSNKRIDNTSGYKGVTKEQKKWTARIRYNGQRKRLGSFNTLEEAAIKYNQAAIKYYGEFAKLNTISCDFLSNNQEAI